MKTNLKNLFIAMLSVAASVAAIGCAEEGESGEAALDCGEHGTEHDGHCHCDEGWLFDGAACVTPTGITALCGEGGYDDHAACLCPEDGDCPCEDGEIEEHDGAEYCVPELHEDE
ncbi:MAG: hypothetical protein M0R80_30215 [Proteobacteria bacterium]|nr:hypothetical protein [Pseudomonadota bacterium]